MALYRIPFNKPSITGKELEYMAVSLRNGHISGDGAFTRRCRETLEMELSAAGVLLTTSCTHALELTALLLDIRPGDEVVVPSFTFVSTVNAFVLRGAVPVFADIRRDTLNIDETQIEALITPRTKAIVVVHYAGVGCEMDAILAVAARHGVAVVEDNAHGLFARYRGRRLGSFGALATQSFHETKNFTCGEGGALVLNDGRFLERAEILREKGTDRSRFFRGHVDKYSWVDVGSSYVLSDLLAAYLWAQLEQRDAVQESRRGIWNKYQSGLGNWASQHDVCLPVVPPHCEQSYHMFYMLLPSVAVRQSLIEHLKGRSILSVFHYLPLNQSAMGIRCGGRAGQCPVAEDVSDRLLRLPFYKSLSATEQDEVIEQICGFDMARVAGCVSG
jgi:dTDP-4-amino-4,6-dideoxygalactose transaminase